MVKTIMVILSIICLIFILINKFKVETEATCYINNDCKKFILSWIKYRLNSMFYLMDLRNKVKDIQDKYNKLLETRQNLFTSFEKIYGKDNSEIFNNLIINELNIKVNMINANEQHNTVLFNNYKEELYNNSSKLSDLLHKINSKVKKEELIGNVFENSDIFVKMISKVDILFKSALVSNTLESAAFLI